MNSQHESTNSNWFLTFVLKIFEQKNLSQKFLFRFVFISLFVFLSVTGPLAICLTMNVLYVQGSPKKVYESI